MAFAASANTKSAAPREVSPRLAGGSKNAEINVAPAHAGLSKILARSWVADLERRNLFEPLQEHRLSVWTFVPNEKVTWKRLAKVLVLQKSTSSFGDK